MDWARIIGDFVEYVEHARHARKVKDMKKRLRRYMEKAQAGGRGAVWPTLASFEEHGVVQKGEKEVAEEATVHLFKDGILEYSDGRYYFKGNVPRPY